MSFSIVTVERAGDITCFIERKRSEAELLLQYRDSKSWSAFSEGCEIVSFEEAAELGQIPDPELDFLMTIYEEANSLTIFYPNKPKEECYIETSLRNALEEAAHG